MEAVALIPEQQAIHAIQPEGDDEIPRQRAHLLGVNKQRLFFYSIHAQYMLEKNNNNKVMATTGHIHTYIHVHIYTVYTHIHGHFLRKHVTTYIHSMYIQAYERTNIKYLHSYMRAYIHTYIYMSRSTSHIFSVLRATHVGHIQSAEVDISLKHELEVRTWKWERNLQADEPTHVADCLSGSAQECMMGLSVMVTTR